jgi:hypothetical protein
MEGFWPIFFLLVVLKIPVFGALWLVWWASREPEPEAAEDDSGEGFDRWRPMPRRPRGPHNLPGGGAAVRGRGAPAPEPAPALLRGRRRDVAHKFRRRGTPAPATRRT